MTAEQVSLFGELDGLFAPELLPCTPPDQVVLIPDDHIAAMRGLEWSPATAERIRRYETSQLPRVEPEWRCVDCDRPCATADARMTADGPWCDDCDTDPAPTVHEAVALPPRNLF